MSFEVAGLLVFWSHFDTFHVATLLIACKMMSPNLFNLLPQYIDLMHMAESLFSPKKEFSIHHSA
jgi:hypothetical protein